MAVGMPEIILLLGIALLLFGPNKIPELARSLGQATTQYRKGLQEVKTSILEDSNNALTAEERQMVSTAKSLGIPTENRSIEEIAHDLLSNTSGQVSS